MPPSKLPTCLSFFIIALFAACAPIQKQLPERKWEDIWDPTSLRTPDSLKYLLSLLDTVYKKDQYYRRFLTPKPGEEQVDYPEDLLWKKIGEWDKENLKVVEEIIAKHGFLGHKEVGLKGATAIFMVLQHSNQATREKYLNLIEKAQKENNILGPHYAMYVDRISKAHHKPQKYGTQLLQLGKQKPELYPLLNADSVDHWRNEIKMFQSMQDYLKIFNLEWNVEEYKKRHEGLMRKYKVGG